MVTPTNFNQPYKTLYHDFTDAYTHLYQVSKELYPAARRFVEKTEPEISLHISKLSLSGAAPSGIDISRYLSKFDDFTISANKVFGEINAAIKRSETLINRKLEIQKSVEASEAENSENYIELIPELGEMLATLQKTQQYCDELEKHLVVLKKQWDKIKNTPR